MHAVIDTITVRKGADVTAYLAVHQAMRTSNTQLVEGLVGTLHYDPRRVAALRRWFEGYTAELRTHHHIEDDLIFPALAERSSAFRLLNGLIDADHHRLDELMDALSDVLTRWAACHDMRSTGTYREDAIFYAVALRDLLTDHLAFEDTDVIPLIQEHFTAEEYAQFDEQAARAISLKHAFWTVPWIVDTFDPVILEQLWADAPVMLKLIHRVSHRSYARLVAVAFGAGQGSARGRSGPAASQPE